MIDYITTILNENIVAQGGLIVLLSGSAMGIFYKTYGYIIRFFQFFLFTRITVESNDGEPFRIIQYWLHSQNYMEKRCSKFQLKNMYLQNEDHNVLVPDYGNHYFCIGWRPAILNYSRLDKENYGQTRVISLDVIKIFNKSSFVQSLFKDAEKTFKVTPYINTKIFNSGNGYSEPWSELITKEIKETRPILKDENEYNILLEDLKHFLNNEEWYKQRGINYKRGYLFYGPAGGGKTSCILSLAQDLKKHICMINLSGIEITNSRFLELITQLPDNSILCLEDVDALECTNERGKINNKEKLTEFEISQKINKTKNMGGPKSLMESLGLNLTTILNSFDGIFTPRGLIFFMTTNYIDKLDKALIRPGRVDIARKFDKSNEYQTRTIFKKFLPEAPILEEEKFIKENIGKSMAALESKLIEISSK